ncbi:DUF6382 domain-containing protein [Clostridium transplantifaecale]|uniref:DUF6382 domain-containing protein n=1 Tax=Clostridium transplantifaecale TaxID=2479838 RepID=UPI000F6333D0|nr:DUF6382 domain-containing protein [Clostridium transplantifaecale]
MEVRYQREVNHNYMILDAPGQGGGYECRMLAANTIKGLLKFRVRQYEEKREFYYEITSKQPLKRLLEQRKISGGELRSLLLGISAVTVKIEEFLLKEEQLLLDPDFIYIDPDSFAVYLCLLPGYSCNFPEVLSGLLQYLLEKINHQDREGVVMAYNLYQESLRENYGMANLLRHLTGTGDAVFGNRGEGGAVKRGGPGYTGRVGGLCLPENSFEEHDTEEHRARQQDREMCSQISHMKGTYLAGSGKEASCMEGLYTKGLFSESSYAGEPYIDALYTKPAHTKPSHMEDSCMPSPHQREFCPGRPGNEKCHMEKNETGGQERGKKGPKNIQTGEKTEQGRGRIRIKDCLQVLVFLAGAVFGVWYFTGTEGLERYGLWLAAGAVIIFIVKFLSAYVKEEPGVGDTKISNKSPTRRMTGNRTEKAEDRIRYDEQDAIAGAEFRLRPESEEEYHQRMMEERKREEQHSREEGTALLSENAGQSAGPVLVSMGENENSIEIPYLPFVIGKHAELADFCLSRPTVSRLHLRIDKREGVYIVTDLNSTNGTAVEGYKLQANETVSIRDGDIISIAEVKYRFAEMQQG